MELSLRDSRLISAWVQIPLLAQRNNVYNKYAKYNLIVQIVIFLHWTKELNLKLNFNLISNLITSCLKESENNSYLKYLKLVFPNLDNLKNLIQ